MVLVRFDEFFKLTVIIFFGSYLKMKIYLKKIVTQN